MHIVNLPLCEILTDICSLQETSQKVLVVQTKNIFVYVGEAVYYNHLIC